MRLLTLIIALSLVAFVTGCDRSGGATSDGGTHTHADGTTHGGPAHAESAPADAGDHDHEHDETDLGTTMVGDMEVTAAQGHGMVEAGKLCHLVVKLPHDDGGATMVRAWIGTEDRDSYMVGKADYAASHDDYDIHVEAPDPLPAGAAWWIEVEKPDGTIATGTIAMLTNG